MPQFIEADVIQKIATPAEWDTLLGTKIPYKGQIMLVSDGTGKVINIKVGDGTNNFASLEYMFDTIQANVNYVQITSAALPTPTITSGFSVVGEGTYTKSGQANVVVPAGSLGILGWNGAVWSLSQSVVLPTVDTSNLLPKSSLGTNSLIDPSSTYIKVNTLINTSGSILTNATSYAGAYAIADFPLEANTQYALGGFLASSGKNFALADSSGGVVQIGNLGTLPKVFTTDATHTFLRAAIKQPTATEPGDNWTATLMLNKGSSLQPRSVNKIDSKDLQALSLQVGNSVPSPTSAENALNKAYFDTYGLRVSDMTITKSANLADPNAIISGQFIGNNGNINSAAGWKMIAIDVSTLSTGAVITFGRFAIDSGGYSAFHNSTGLVQYNGSYVNANLPVSVTKPAGATILYIDISRPTGTNEYNEITVNVGGTLIDYVPFASISKLRGYTVGGGSSNVKKFSDLTDVPSYAGNANKGLKINSTANGVATYNPVEQNKDAVLGSASVSALIIRDIPVWNETGSPPILVGDDYNFPDGNGNYFRKTRGV